MYSRVGLLDGFNLETIQSIHLRKKCMSTLMMHRYQNTVLKWTILGNYLGQWQLHIIYNFF